MWTGWSVAATRRDIWLAGLARPAMGNILFVLDWTIMSAAMMLPTAMSLFDLLSRLDPAGRRRRVAIAAVAIVALWATCGIVVRAAAITMVSTSPLDETTVAALLLLAGGTYLMSPIAGRCAKACRTPYGFIALHWRGRKSQFRASVRIGAAYGLSCVGCCWPVMVAMSVLALHGPVWMLAATLMMLWQRSSPLGEQGCVVVGAALVLLGVSLKTGLISPPSNDMLLDIGRICGSGAW